MSGEKDNEFFSDGVSEEIINALTQINGLRVAGRTSSFAFKGTRVDLAKVGEQLNVDTVLEGSVRKSGNRLRITAQLVKASDGYHLWSERFDRELDDVFAVQDEIANAIASKLKLSLDHSGELAKPLTTSVEAYELFVKGRALYYLPGRPLVDAIVLFEKAIRLDPNFASAHAALADALALSGYYGLVRPAEIADRAQEAASRAVALAPGSADAHHAVALCKTFYGKNRDEALLEWNRVLSGSSLRTTVRCSYAVFALGLLSGKWEAGVDELSAVIGLDPLNGFAHSMLALLKTFMGDTTDVVAYARRGLELDEDSFWGHLGLQRALHCAGLHDEAQKHGITSLDSFGRHPWMMAELAVDYASVGEREKAEAILEELRMRGRFQYMQPSPMALAATAAGRLDEAIDLCHKAFDEHDAHILWAIIEVWDGWQPLYKHPQWKEVRRRASEWLNARESAAG
jgi:TolB-like protein